MSPRIQNSEYGWRVDQDAFPARSQQMKNWGKGSESSLLGFVLEVRQPEGFAGSIRLGELVITTRADETLTCSIWEQK